MTIPTHSTSDLDDLSKPVTWQDPHHSYAADAGAPKPVTSVRPSKQGKSQKSKPTTEIGRFEQQTIDMGKIIDKATGRNQFAPANLEDQKSADEDKTPKDLRQQLIKSRIADVENPANKNPFRFTHPLDQQAATYAKVQRIIKNPNFSSLPQDKKDRVLSNYYDKYVVPVYHNAQIAPPPKSEWTSQVQKGFFKVSDFYDYSVATNKDAVSDLSAGVVHAQASAVQTAGHIGHAILMAGVKTDRKILGLANFFPGSALHSWATEQADFDARIAGPAIKMSQDMIDRSGFWLDTHQSKHFTETASSFIGENAVQLPLYEAIGLPIKMLGTAVTSAGGAGRAANFTRMLATSKTGRFIGRRMADAAGSYIGDSFSETPEGQRATDMAVFLGFQSGMEGLGLLAKPISRAAMKRVAANNIAVGGKILHETIGDQAEFELVHGIVGTDSAGNPIPFEDGKFSEQMAAAKQADPVKHATVTAEKISQNAMARQLYGKPLRELSQLQRRKVRVALIHLSNEATYEIPIHVPEVAHHEVQQSIQQDVQNNPALAGTFSALEKKYGAKIEDVLIKEEQDTIAAETGIKSTQGATERVGKNEKILADANQSLGKNRSTKNTASKTKEDQIFNELSDTGNARYYYKNDGFNLKFVSKVDKALYRVSGEVQHFGGPETKKRLASYENSMRKLKRYFPDKTEDEIKDLAKQMKAHIDEQILARRADPKFKNNTHPSPLEIDINRFHDRGAVTSVKAEKDDLPKNYVSFRQQAISHFINPFNSKAATEKKTLAKFLEGMDDSDFIQEVSDQMGNQIKFEKPYDMLLWGLHYRNHLPTPVVAKIKSVLHAEDPAGTYVKWYDEAKRLGAHIDMLAMSGRLDTEGNVFRSTITTSFTGRTRWQREAEQEAALAEIENYKNTMAPYKKNFPDEYEAGLKNLAKLQMLRKASKTDEDFFAAHARIKKLIESTEKPKKSKGPKEDIKSAKTVQNDEGYESDEPSDDSYDASEDYYDEPDDY